LERQSSNPDWKYIVSPEGGHNELFAIVYNKRKLVWSRDGDLVPGSTQVRRPYAAKFRVAEANAHPFDFVIVLVHTKVVPDGILRRELKGCATDLVSVSNSQAADPDIIMLGDFNISPSTRTHSLWMDSGLGVCNWALNPPNSGRRNETVSMAGAAILNDNFVWLNPTNEDFTGDAGSIDFEMRYNNDPSNRRISDHRLIWAEFWTFNDESG
jgi:hypothetical protein